MPKRKITDGLTLLTNGLYERKVTMSNGKRKAFRSKIPSEVWQKITDFQEAEEKGPFFEAVAKKYYVEKIDTAKIGTQRAYKPAYKLWIDEFTGVRIANIKIKDINIVFNRLAAQGMAYTTVANRKIVLSGIFDTWIASEEWYGDSNPVTLIKLPRGLSRIERDPPTKEQVKKVKIAFESAIAAKQISNEILFAALLLYTGARRGEILALQPNDIDLDKNILTISKQVQHENNQPQIVDTKSKAGVRLTPILDPLKNILALCEFKNNSSFIIGNDEKPLSATQYNHLWVNFCRSIDLARCETRTIVKRRRGREDKVNVSEWKPIITAHQFRHEFCTVLFEAGVPEEIAVHLMGHADSKTIHRVYFHMRERSVQNAALMLNSYFAEHEKGTVDNKNNVDM